MLKENCILKNISKYAYMYIHISGHNTYICIYTYTIYVYMYIHMSGHKWSTTHRVLKSHRDKTSVIYMLSWKQCVLPVTTPMAHVPRCMSYHKAIVVITGKAHCLHDNIYVYTYIYIYIYQLQELLNLVLLLILCS